MAENATVCGVCHRPLTDPVSVALKVGPECRGKAHKNGRRSAGSAGQGALAVGAAAGPESWPESHPFKVAGFEGESEIPIRLIRLSGGTQPRAEMSIETMEEYAELIREMVKLPPVVVFWDGKSYWLADGFHRLGAANLAGKQTVLATVVYGGVREARLHAAGANAQHGLRRNNADKRLAVLTLLEDAEWSEWSDREIARRCAVSNRFVGNLRNELSVNGSQIDSEDTPEQPTTRKVKRGDQVYEMNVAPIGQPAGEESDLVDETQQAGEEPEEGDDERRPYEDAPEEAEPLFENGRLVIGEIPNQVVISMNGSHYVKVQSFYNASVRPRRLIEGVFQVIGRELPRIYPSPEAAIGFAVGRGVFEGFTEAQRAYERVRAECKPTSALEMATLWNEELRARAG